MRLESVTISGFRCFGPDPLSVLGTAGPGLELYKGAFKDYPDLLPDYRYHFLTHSKPTTHLVALTHIKSKSLREDMPPLLAELLKHVADSLRRD